MDKKVMFSGNEKVRSILIKVKIPSKITFILLGALSTLWFLIRVIPKPQRAAYPCMKASAPWASAFVLYVLGLASSFFSIKRSLKHLIHAKYFPAFIFLSMAGTISFLSLPLIPSRAFPSVSAPSALGEPTSPIGTAKGINPGRVVWLLNKNATNESCTNKWNDGYFLDKNTDQDIVDAMLKNAVLLLTDKKTVKEAWDAIFKFHNMQRGKGGVNYQSGEKIFLKINSTSSWGGNYSTSDLSRAKNSNYAISETSPQLVTSVLRHLVNEVGAVQSDIYIGDPMKHIYKYNYEKWHKEFPDIHYLDNSYSTLGREQATKSTTAIIDYSDRGKVLREGSWSTALTGDPIQKDYLYSIFEEMDYMINIPTLKGHKHAGVTMFAKNHFGSQARDDAKHLHGGLVKAYNDPLRNNYGMYRVQVDLMGHELLGKKNLIYLLDALYCAEIEINKPCKFLKSPWNNDWTSSIFISQDPVAIESVGFDVLYYELDGTNGLDAFPHLGAVDDYLHQAADETNWPKGITYDPENDGSKIESLGVHEHWNNPTDRQYSRNLGTGNGIELMFYDQIALETGTLTTNNSDLPSNQVNSIYIDSSNTLWAGTDAGLSGLSQVDWKHYDTILFHNHVNDIAYECTNYGKELWVATDSGLTVASYTDVDGITSATTYVPKNSALVGSKISCIDVDVFHNRWIGTDSALCVFKGQKWDRLQTGSDADGENFDFSSNKITGIKAYLVDSLTLISTAGKGIVRMRYDEVDGFTGASTYGQPWAAIVSDTITSIDVDDKIQWYGTNMGLQLHKTNRTKDDWILYTTESGLTDNRINTVHVDKSGNAWVGTPSGISIVTDDGGIFKLTEDEGLLNNQVNDICGDIDGNTWIATSGGIQWFNGLSGTQTVLGIPELIFPENYQTNIEPGIKLTWGSITGASKYTLQLSRDKNFSILSVDAQNIGDTSYTLTNLSPDTTYFWRVLGKSDLIQGDWSAKFQFTVKHLTGMQGAIAHKNDIQIFPNPAKDNISIKIIPEKTQNIRLNIYTMNGQLIYSGNTFRTESQGSTVRLDISDPIKYPSGLYLIEISADNFSYIKKISIN
jgi:sugar lactone lactonase YvrE